MARSDGSAKTDTDMQKLLLRLPPITSDKSPPGPTRRIAVSVQAISKPHQRANAGLAIDVADALEALRVPRLPAAAAKSLGAIVKRADSAGTGVPVSVAAGLLGVTQPTVRAWIERGVLNATKETRPVLVRPRSLGEVLEAVAWIRSEVGEEPRLLNYLSERREFDDLRRRISELSERRELDPERVEEQLFS